MSKIRWKKILNWKEIVSLYNLKFGRLNPRRSIMKLKDMLSASTNLSRDETLFEESKRRKCQR